MSKYTYARSPDYDAWCIYRKISDVLMTLVCRCKTVEEAMEKCAQYNHAG